jgi:hypothetical protein
VRGRRAAAAAAFCVFAAGLGLAANGALALSPPAPPRGNPTPTPSPPPPNSSVLAAGSQLNLVLDEPIDSSSTAAGTLIKLHLEKALEVGGVALAPAGAPGTLKVIGAQKAVAPDRDGTIEIYLQPLPLGAHGSLPLRFVHEYLSVELTAGQTSTNQLTDLAKDVYIPGHAVYRAFRKGRDLSLPAGTILRARTGATIDATNPSAIAIVTPPPFVTNNDPIHADFTPIPFFTVAPPPPKRPRPSPTPHVEPTQAQGSEPIAAPSPIPQATSRPGP